MSDIRDWGKFIPRPLGVDSGRIDTRCPACPDLENVWLDRGWWLMPNGQRRLLSWNAATKELRLWGLKRWIDEEDATDHLVLAVIETEDEVVRRLDGWDAHNDTKEGLSWLAAQLDGCR